MQNRFAFGQSDTSTKGTMSCGILQVHPFAGSHFSIQPYTPACFSKQEYPLTVQHFVAEQSSLLVADQGLLHIGFGFCATICVKPIRWFCTVGSIDSSLARPGAPLVTMATAAAAAAASTSTSAPGPQTRPKRLCARGCSMAANSSCRQISLSDMILPRILLKLARD